MRDDFVVRDQWDQDLEQEVPKVSMVRRLLDFCHQKLAGVTQNFQAMLSINLQLARDNTGYIVLFFVALWFNCICANWAYYKYYKENLHTREPLVDVAARYLPRSDLNLDLLYVSYFVCVKNGILGVIGLLMMPPEFLAQRGMPMPFSIFQRVTVCLTIGVLLRISTFSLTLAPGPMNMCHKEFDVNRVPQNWFSIFFRLLPEDQCGEFLLSGPCLILTLCTICAVVYSPFPYFARIIHRTLSLSAFLTFMYATVASRRYYSVDLMVGAYTTILIWMASYSLNILDDVKDRQILKQLIKEPVNQRQIE